MPHDKFGSVVHDGDEVLIRFRVKKVHASEEACNVDLVSVESMPPYPDSFIQLSAVNTRQTEKVGPVPEFPEGPTGPQG